MKYLDKLLNPKWKIKRAAILRRDKRKCTVCGSKKDLQIHHTYYVEGREPWEYPNKSLITLCRDCHYKFHCEHEVKVKKEWHKKKLKRKKAVNLKIKKVKKLKPYESHEPRYRKKVNGEWQIIESN
jgi:5-methylcytosine-specific restriction endonuclease McrA